MYQCIGPWGEILAKNNKEITDTIPLLVKGAAMMPQPDTGIHLTRPQIVQESMAYGDVYDTYWQKQ